MQHDLMACLLKELTPKKHTTVRPPAAKQQLVDPGVLSRKLPCMCTAKGSARRPALGSYSPTLWFPLREDIRSSGVALVDHVITREAERIIEGDMQDEVEARLRSGEEREAGEREASEVKRQLEEDADREIEELQDKCVPGLMSCACKCMPQQALVTPCASKRDRQAMGHKIHPCCACLLVNNQDMHASLFGRAIPSMHVPASRKVIGTAPC